MKHKRILTTESYDGCVEAWSEQDDYAAAINHENCACWVWQFADSKDQAVNQHYQRMEDFEKNPELDTY